MAKSLTEKQTEEASSAFQEFLNDGESGLSQVQARTALFKLGLNPTVIDVSKFWADNEKAEEDHMSVEEFLKLRESMNEEDPKETLRWAFKQFDSNGDGTIDKDELKKILATIYDDKEGDLVDEDFVNVCLTLGDTNNDGVLQIEEFVDMLMQRTGKDSNEDSNSSTPCT